MAKQTSLLDNILIENVKEFQSWGPLGTNGRPLKRMRGRAFMSFIEALRALGYNVDWRILNAANYGDPTTRERLFIMARRGNKKIIWPEPTHSAKGASDVFGSTKPWRTAREIIDWSIPGKSIFERKKPLAPSTMNRIVEGLKKFGGKNAEPFLIVFRNHQDASSLDQPIPALTTSGANFGLIEPFLVRYNGGRSEAGKKRVHSVQEPMPTIAAGGEQYALCEPFILPQFGGNVPRSIDLPLNTLSTTSRGIKLVQPFIVPLNHGKDDKRSHSIDNPMPALTTVDAWGLIEPYLVKFYGNGSVQSVREPLHTIRTKDSFGLVQPGETALDIRFRMLQPHELARAMSFPDDYRFSGNREAKVKQIGNAVPVNLAEALCESLLGGYSRKDEAA
jgi:DNA (cytosine-5)-methyltransferase 1